jgi:ferrochelatase
VYDLDVEAQQLCNALGLPLTRAKTVGVHPKFIGMIRELIQERMNPQLERRAMGSLGPRTDICAADCCPAPQRPARKLQES